MNNRWNQFIYRIWAPFYDRLFNSGPFLTRPISFIIPLLLIAFSKVYLTRKRFYNPKKILKAESLAFILVIGCTAFHGILSPPHDINFTIESKGASPLAEYLAGEHIHSPLQLP